MPHAMMIFDGQELWWMDDDGDILPWDSDVEPAYPFEVREIKQDMRRAASSEARKAFDDWSRLNPLPLGFDFVRSTPAREPGSGLRVVPAGAAMRKLGLTHEVVGVGDDGGPACFGVFYGEVQARDAKKALDTVYRIRVYLAIDNNVLIGDLP